MKLYSSIISSTSKYIIVFRLSLVECIISDVNVFFLRYVLFYGIVGLEYSCSFV